MKLKGILSRSLDFECKKVAVFAIGEKVFADVVSIPVKQTEVSLAEVFAEIRVGHEENSVIDFFAVLQELIFFLAWLDVGPKLFVFLATLALPLGLAPGVPQNKHLNFLIVLCFDYIGIN